MQIRPRRSALYMPADNARAVAKARTLPADAVILDLEDAVAPDAKAAARAAAARAVGEGGFGDREVLVRINGVGTPWAMDDLAAAVAAAPDGIVVPKVSAPEVLALLAGRLRDLRAPRHIRLWPMIETPLAVLRVHDLAMLAQDGETRLAGLIVGTNDLVKEARGRIVPGRAPLVPWLAACVAAARAYDLAVLDGPYNDFKDADGLARECAQGRDMGFDGKTAIHPAQLETCNAAFSPSREEIEEAREIVAAFDVPEHAGKGVVQIGGRMVERLHADIARRTLSLAAAIAARP